MLVAVYVEPRKFRVLAEWWLWCVLVSFPLVAQMGKHSDSLKDMRLALNWLEYQPNFCSLEVRS